MFKNHIILILNEFRHVWKSYQFVSVWFWTNLDMFENHINCNNFYSIESEQFETYLRIIWIVTIPDFTNNNKNERGFAPRSQVVLFAMFCYILLYFAIFCHILLYFAIFCYTWLYLAILGYTLLYLAISCYTLLYFLAISCYTLVYLAILCHTWLYFAILGYTLLV